MVVDDGPAVGKAGLIALSVGESEARGNGSDPTGAVRLHEFVVARANSEVPLASAHLHDGLEASVTAAGPFCRALLLSSEKFIIF